MRADGAGLAVVLAAGLATALRIVWYGPLAGRASLLPGADMPGGTRRPTGWVGVGLALLVGAAMLGHMFARLSPGKSWLYFMMSGGVAIAFIIPAVWIAHGQRPVPGGPFAREAAYWLFAYLGMGTVFWLLS
jgi:hypothetical protein